MAPLPLRLTEFADADLTVLHAYHRERVLEFDSALGALFERLQEFPGAYPRWRGNIRRIITPKFYLAIHYRIFSDHILILGVTDQRQDPRRLRLYAPPR